MTDNTGIAALCRMDANLAAAICDPGRRRAVVLSSVAAIVAGSALYGFAFGLWRSPLQGFIAAAKLPLVCLAVTGLTTPVNTMLAQLTGAGLSWRETGTALLAAMAVASALMGALSPISAFVVMHAPAPDPLAMTLPSGNPAVVESMRVFRALLLFHVGVMGACGLVGYGRLFRFLRTCGRTKEHAASLLVIWTLITGFTGCEISWLLSPFLCKPTFPPHVVTRTYFDGNFYEHMFAAVSQVMRPRCSEAGAGRQLP